MPGTIRTAYEIAIRGGTESEAQLRNVGKVGAEAFAKIDAAAKVVPTSLRAVDAAASTMRGSVERLAASTGPLGAALSAIGGPIGLLGVAATGASLGILAMAKNAIATGDNIADAARKVGIGVEKFQALQFGARLAGVETAALEGALKKFGTGVAAAGIGTGSLVKTLEILDPALLRVLQDATSVDQAFTAMAAKIAATKEPFEQVQLAVAAFGAQAAEAMLPVIVNLEATTKRANELHIIMGGDLVRSSDSAQDALDTLSTTVKVNLDAALIALAPTIESTANKLADLAARVAGFFQSISGLEAVENQLAKLRNQRDNLDNADPGTVPANARGKFDQKIADLEAERRQILANKDADAARAAAQDKAAKARHDAFLKLGADHRDDLERQKAGTKAANDAEAAAKRAVDARAKGLDQVIQLEQEAHTAGLDGIEEIEAKRDVAYEKFATLAKESNLTQEEAARGYVAIWEAADRDITAFRQTEADKQAEIARRASDKAAREAERAADQIERQQLQLAETVGDAFGDALVDFVDNGKLQFEDLWEGFLNTGLRALAQMAAQQLILNIGANVTATGGGATAAVGSGGGTSLGGILQQGQQILSLGKSLKGGFDFLTGALGASTAATVDLTAATGILSSSVNVIPGTVNAALFGIENAGSIAIAGQAGVAPGTGALAINAAGQPVGAVGGAGSGAASGLAGAASSAAILFAVVAALETIGAAVNVGKARDTLFSHSDTADVAEQSFDKFTLAIGNVLTYALAGASAKTLFESQQRSLYGGADVKDIVYTTILNILNPLNFAIGIAGKLPTKGTVLRKGFEEFLEHDGAAVGFFGRNSGTFARGIGQTGTFRHGGPEFHSDRVERVLSGGARGIQDELGVDFLEAQKIFIERQRESIGLTQEQLKEVTALGAAFRAIVGGKAGDDESRVFGLIADFLGSITAEGAGAAETLEIVREAFASLGRPQVLLERLNDFFTSGDNDLAVDTYREAVQGLAAAFFSDLPAGVDAAALALDELNQAGDGLVLFEDIEDRIKAAVVEAESLGPAIQGAFLAAFDSVGVNADELGEQLFDGIETGLKDTIAQAIFDGLIEGQFKGDVLGPFLATLEEVKAKLAAGELTDAEASAILAQAAAGARANLETFRPLIDQAVAAGQDLAAVFDDVAANAEAAADAILRTTLSDLGTAVAADPSAFLADGLVTDRAIAQFHDAVLAAMRDATLQGFVQAMVTSAIQPAILTPFTQLSQETIAGVQSGELTPEEGAARIAAGFADVRASLSELDPILRTFIEGIAELGEGLDIATDATAVRARAAAESILQGALGDLAGAVAADPSAFIVDGALVSPQAIDQFHTTVLEAMRDAVLQGFVQGMVTSVLEPAVLAPFLEIAQGAVAGVQSGDLTPGEGADLIAAAFNDAQIELHELDPVLRTFIESIAELSDGLRLGTDAAGARASFEAGIDRELLGALSPDLGAQFDLEVKHRERLFQARQFGLDLTKIERLNALERTAIAEESAAERTRIEEQASEQISRIMQQARAAAERSLQGIADFVQDQLGSPASPLPPEQALATAQAEFTRLASLARGGDQDALDALPEAAQDVIGLLRTLYGSTGTFFAEWDPIISTLQELGTTLDPSDVRLSADAQAQIDAINADAAEQLAQADQHHDEAMALFRAMLDALTVAEGGLLNADAGTRETDHRTQEIPGPGAPSSGRYDLDAYGQHLIRNALGGLTAGGETEQGLRQLLSVGSIADLRTLSGVESTLGNLAEAILTNFPGIRTMAGVETVVGALIGKIHNPETFSPVLGFNREGNFTLRGPDTIPLIPGRVHMAPGENAVVSRGNLEGRLVDLIAMTARQTEELRGLRRDYAATQQELAAMRSLYQQSQVRPRSFGVGA